MKIYAIYNPASKLWWHDDHGWIADVLDGSTYSSTEVEEYLLPMGGQWICLCNNNA